jgi:hypothetical protein
VIPATLVGRLARHLSFCGQRIGELLIDALRRCLEGSRRIASRAVIADAANPAAAAFYKRHGFIPLPDFPERLFLPMKTVEGMNLV